MYVISVAVLHADSKMLDGKVAARWYRMGIVLGAKVNTEASCFVCLYTVSPYMHFLKGEHKNFGVFYYTQTYST